MKNLDLQKLIFENYLYIVSGLVLGVIIVGSYKYYNFTIEEKSAKAGDLYEILSKTSDDEEIYNISEKIIEEYNDTVYSIFTRLYLAKHYHGKNDYQKAQSHLSFIIDNDFSKNYKELAKIMYNAGLRIVFVGIESINPDSIKKAKRQSASTDIQLKGLNALEKVGVSVKAMFIIGFPGDSYQNALRTINYACKLPITYPQFSVFTPYPGTPIFDILNVVKPNVIALGYDQKHSIDSIRNGLDEHGFSDVELTRVEGLSDDLDGTRKIIARILDLWPNSEGGPYEED